MANFSISQLVPRNIKDFQFWAKSQSVVGIDIGSSSIKVIQLRKEKEQAVLETYGELAAGPYADRPIGQAVRLPEEKIISMLKDLFKEAGVNAKKGVVSIPLKSSFLTTIKMPRVAGKEMNEMIKFEARKYIPVSPDEVELDWWVLPDSSKRREKDDEDEEEEKPPTIEETSKIKNISEILLVAIHKDTVQKYKDIISKAGLKTSLFEIEAFSVLRSSIVRQVAPVMIIDLGASSTKISVVDYGILKMTPHTIDKGAQGLTNAVARSLGVSFERAEEMKYQIGLSSRPEHKELVSVMEPILNFIFAEARQIMLNYRRKTSESVGRVILTGGGALLKNIVDTAVQGLGVEVSLADPFARAQYPPFLQEVLKEIGPTFSTAVGLALREL
jgi:type IV pilus assembly protein PilM